MAQGTTISARKRTTGNDGSFYPEKELLSFAFGITRFAKNSTEATSSTLARRPMLRSINPCSDETLLVPPLPTSGERIEVRAATFVYSFLSQSRTNFSIDATSSALARRQR